MRGVRKDLRMASFTLAYSLGCPMTSMTDDDYEQAVPVMDGVTTRSPGESLLAMGRIRDR
jgi:hypothetical protein